MKSISLLYRYCNYLSLDVVFGAVVCGAFFARILKVQLLPYGLASLGLTVWIIYTADHLLDAKKLKRVASSQRHRFHQRNFQGLMRVFVIAVLIDILLVLFVRKPILNLGMGLSVIVFLYLLLQRKLLVFKELAVALLYSAGILLPAMSLTMISLSSSIIILILIFAQTAFINLVLFSWYDWKQDIKDNHFSLATNLGKSRVKNILIVLFLVQAALFVVLLLMTSYHSEAFILIGMNLTLLMLLVFPTIFSEDNQYRLIGDSIFVFPVLYLL